MIIYAVPSCRGSSINYKLWPMNPQNPTINSCIPADLLHGKEAGQAQKAGKQVYMTSRHWASQEMVEEEEEEEEGEGTRAGLSPLTTGPGLPSNPWAPCTALCIVREQRQWEEGRGGGGVGMGRWGEEVWVKLWLKWFTKKKGSDDDTWQVIKVVEVEV